MRRVEEPNITVQPRATTTRSHLSVAATCLTLALALVASRPASGQEVLPDPSASLPEQSPDASALSLEQLLSVEIESVFGASKSLQKITEAPAAVTVVTADEIARFGWRTLADVLRNVRGFYVTNDRTYEYVGTRGFLRPGDYSTRVLLTIDGRRVNDNVFDQALIAEGFQLDLADAERIEIIRGPSSSLYGSSAFFGVVNVVTKSATAGRSADVTVGGGTLGHGEIRLRGRHTFASGVSVSGSGGETSEDGVTSLYYPEYDAADTNFGLAIGRDYLRRQNLFGRVDYRGWSFVGGYNQRRRGLPTGAYEVLFNRDSWVLDTHGRLDASWSGHLGGWTSTLRGSYDRYEFTGSYSYDWDEEPSTPAVDYIDRARGHWWSSEAQFSRTFSARHEVTAGVETRFNTTQRQYSYLEQPYEFLWSDDRRTTVAGFYLQDQIRVHRRLLLNLGLRQDHYAEFQDPIKPRLAAIYQPGPETTVKVMYGNAFRAPNVFESHYLIPGQWTERPDLHPEAIRTFETIVEHYAGKRLRLSAGTFHYAVDDLIDFTNDADGLLLFANLGTARASGVEAEVEAKWPSGLQTRVSYSYANARITDTSEPLSNSPRHLTQALISTPVYRNIFASVTLQALSARLSRTGATVPAYVRPDISITSPLFSARARMSLVVNNLTNTSYCDPVGDDFAQDTVAQNGRTARLFVTWGF
jgi:iron complex outermembrane receptor protein